MSYPVGEPPSSAYVAGTVGDAQGQSEESIRAMLRGGAGIGGLGSWDFAQAFFQIQVVGPLLKNELDVQSLDRRVTVLEGVGERIIYTVSQTWTNPHPGQRVKVGIGALCGGHGGQQGITSDTTTRPIGGLGSGWVYREIFTDELPETVAIVIGSAGGNNGGLGGVSSFGSFLTSNWGRGGILTPQGVVETASSAGNGGDGVAYQAGAGNPGQSSALAPGGAAGTAVANGMQGGNAPTDGLAPGGGAGGGAGFGSGNATTAGGAGGFPGGGGGAGASSYFLGSTRVSNGGGGGPGAVFVTIYSPDD